MQVFHDKNGKAWEIELNIGKIKRLKAHLDIDLENTIKFNEKNQPADVSLLNRLATDAIFLFDVIYLICKDRIDEEKLTDEQFAELFNGDAIEEATNALLDEIINFSRPAKRKILLQLQKISRDFSAKAGLELEKILTDPKFTAEMEEVLRQQSTNTPESSE